MVWFAWYYISAMPFHYPPNLEVDMSDIAPSASAGLGFSKKSAGRYAAYVFWIMFSINLLNNMDRYVFIGAANIVAKVLGIGEAGYYPAGTALLSDYFSRTKRAQVMSRWTAGALIGLMIGFIVGGVVAGLGFGMWRIAFLFTGIPGLLLAFLAWRIREPRRNQADEEAIELDPHSAVNEVEVIDSPHAIVVPKNVFKQF